MKCHFNYFQAYIICICDSFLQLKVLFVVVKKSWVCKNEYSNTRLCAVWTTDSAPHYNVSNSTCLKLLLNEKGFILISVIQFWFSFMSIITLFMFILCEIQTQFSCYECDIFLFSNYLITFIHVNWYFLQQKYS